MSSEAGSNAAKERGNALFKAGNYRDAVAAYTEAIVQDSANAPLLLLNRCAAYLALNDFKNALNDGRSAVQKQGTPSAKALTRVAKCYIGLGELSSAAESARAAAEAPGATPAEQTQARDVAEQVQEIEKHLASFDTYIKEKNWTLASIALDQAQRIAKLSESTSPAHWKLLRATLYLLSLIHI